MNTSPSQPASANLSAQLAAIDARLSSLAEREAKRNHWKDIVIPIASLLVAFAGVLSAALVQYLAIRSQVSLKKYEVTFIAKQRAYAEVMSSLHAVLFASAPQSKEDMFRALDKLHSDIFAVQPFLTPSGQTSLDKDIQIFINLCLERQKGRNSMSKETDQVAGSFLEQTDEIRRRLAVTLFGESQK